MLICPEMMHDIFDELMVTRTTNLLRYISIRMSWSCMYMLLLSKLNKIISYFVDCICVWLILYCRLWQITALLMLLMLSCGMLLCLVGTFPSRSKVIGYILFQKPSKTQPKKLERPGDWYEIDEKWHFLWDFIWISEHDIYICLLCSPSIHPFLPSLHSPSESAFGLLRFWDLKEKNTNCNEILEIFIHCD